MGMYVTTGDQTIATPEAPEVSGLGASLARAFAKTAKEQKARGAAAVKKGAEERARKAATAKLAPAERGALYLKRVLLEDGTPLQSFLSTSASNKTIVSDIVAAGKKMTLSQRKAVVKAIGVAALRALKKDNIVISRELRILRLYIGCIFSRI